MCSLVCISNFQLLENKDTHYLLFYYSFTNMSMNSFARYIPIRVVRRWLTLCERAVGTCNVALNKLPVSKLLATSFFASLAFQFFNFDKARLPYRFTLFSSGEYRSRTDDLLLAKQAL